MPSVEVALVYAIAGSAILCVALKLFKVEYRIWQAIAASVLVSRCSLFDGGRSTVFDVVPGTGSGVL